MIKSLLVFVLLLILTGSVTAAGTAPVTTQYVGSITVYTINWTATAGGAVSANPFDVKVGHVIDVKFVPGTGGDAPDADYDVTLVDEDGIDLLNGTGANLSASAPLLVVFDPLLLHDSRQNFDVVVANAGNANKGTVIIRALEL